MLAALALVRMGTSKELAHLDAELVHFDEALVDLEEQLAELEEEEQLADLGDRVKAMQDVAALEADSVVASDAHMVHESP